MASNIAHLLPWILLVLLAIGWLWRERSLSFQLQTKDSRITELQEYNQVVLLQLQIEMDTKKSLFQWIEEESWDHNYHNTGDNEGSIEAATAADTEPTSTSPSANTPTTPSKNTPFNITALSQHCQQFNHTNTAVLHLLYNVSQHYLPAPQNVATAKNIVYFDLAGWTYLSLFFSLIMYEYYSIYGFSVDIDEDAGQMDKEIFWRTRTFLAKHHPLTSLLFFSIVCIVGSLSWLGIIPNRINIAYWLLKLTLSFALASFLSFVSSNFLRLVKYLPAEQAAWMTAIRDITWWHWFLSRCFGVYDLLNGLSTLLWFAALVWYYWPVRYFFYYLEVSFQDNDALAVFVLNMVTQTAFTSILVYYFYSVSILLPLIVGMKQMPEAEEDVLQRHWLHRIVYQRIKTFLETYFLNFLQRGHNDRTMAILIFMSIVNSLLLLFRVLYFLYTNKCTWYAWGITWMWVHSHVGLSVFALPCINFVMQEMKIQEKTKSPFVAQFVKVAKEKIVEEIQRSRDSVETPIAEEELVDEEELRNAASDIFDTSLSKSVLYCLFVDTKKDEEESTSKPKKEGAEEESRLAVIFTAMLQTEAYAMGTKFANQETTEMDQHSETPSNEGFTDLPRTQEREDDGYVLEEVD